MKPSVYLAGPISGSTYDEANDWRESIIDILAGWGINGLNPLRNKQHLSKLGVLEDKYEKSHPLSTPRGIVGRDRMDATNCNVLLVYFPLGTDRISIGTCIEFGWANANQIPIVVVDESTDKLHNHAMLEEITDYYVEDIMEGVNIVGNLLIAYTESPTTI